MGQLWRWGGEHITSDQVVSISVPLHKMRIEDCQLRVGDPFAEVQIPEAVIALEQRGGRLIRDSYDRGVLIICDQRLVTRP